MRRASTLAAFALALPLLGGSAGAEWFSVSTADLGRLPSVAVENAADYDTFSWIEVEDAATLEAAGFRPADFSLHLGGVSFDPLVEPGDLPSSWTRAGLASRSLDGPDRLHLVQWQGPIRESWVRRLEARGLEIIRYVHPYTFVVHGDLDASFSADPDVRWTGPFEPAYKVQPQWRALDASPRQLSGLLLRSVAEENGTADTSRLLDRLRDLGATDLATAALDRSFLQVKMRMSGDRLLEAARLEGVYMLKPQSLDGGLRGEMSNQTVVGNLDGSNIAFPGYGSWLASVELDGSGVLMANVDGGIYDTHPDLANRMLPCVGDTCGNAAVSSHGTHTAAIMAGDGASGTVDAGGFLRGLGVAPAAHLVEQLFDPTFTQPGGLLKLIRESSQNGAVLSGNSWGPAGTPQGYDDDTMQVDIGVRDAQSGVPGNQAFTYVLSFMNGYGGTSSQGTPDEAKNLFNIGSTKMQTSEGQIPEIFDVSTNSAHGPALDGRTIPHMVAPGCSVDSADSASDYGLKCGTSMASPHVSGAAGLFFEHYRKLTAARGRPTNPSPALVKAAFLVAAKSLEGHDDADGAVLGHPFDSKQGWGRLDLAAVVVPAVPVEYFDDPQILTGTGEEWTVDLQIVDPAEPIRVMLVWTDAPGHGLGGATPAWNNDLDLIVETGAATYRGNHFGPDGFSSTTMPVADGKNNTEGVFLPPRATRILSVRVVASNLNSDGVPGSGTATDQDFALACSNCTFEETPWIFVDGFESGDTTGWN